MRRLMLTTVLALSTSGCAHTLDAGLDGIEKFAAGTRVAVVEGTKLWSAGVDAQIAFCRAKGLGPDASEEDRTKCLGVLGQGAKAEPALEKLGDGYDMIAEGLKLLREAQKELEPYLEAAQEAVKR